jgi:hypothetical protein
VALSVEISLWRMGTAGRFASVGMTRLFRVLGFDTKNSGRPRGALQIPPLRFASVGMTILFRVLGLAPSEEAIAHARAKSVRSLP